MGKALASPQGTNNILEIPAHLAEMDKEKEFILVKELSIISLNYNQCYGLGWRRNYVHEHARHLYFQLVFTLQITLKNRDIIAYLLLYNSKLMVKCYGHVPT